MSCCKNICAICTFLGSFIDLTETPPPPAPWGGVVLLFLVHNKSCAYMVHKPSSSSSPSVNLVRPTTISRTIWLFLQILVNDISIRSCLQSWFEVKHLWLQNVKNQNAAFQFFKYSLAYSNNISLACWHFKFIIHF